MRVSAKEPYSRERGRPEDWAARGELRRLPGAIQRDTTADGSFAVKLALVDGGFEGIDDEDAMN